MGFWAALPGLAAAGGSIWSALSGADAQREANEANLRMNDRQLAFNAEQAKFNREFEERMSNSTWQRGVADMKAAGINPMAAYSSGGASTPSGATASSGSLRPVERVPSVANSILTSALEIARTFAEINKSKATVINLGGQTEDAYSHAFVNEHAGRHYQWLNKLLEAELPGAKAHSFTEWNRYLTESKFPKSFGFADAFLRRLSGPLASFGNSALSMYLGSKLPRLSKRIP